MPHYHSLGQVPHKRHTVFRKPDGGLYCEELVSTEGFSHDASLVYHVHPPTAVLEVDEPIDFAPRVAEAKNMRHRCYHGFNIPSSDDYLKGRRPVLVNDDVCIHLAAPSASMRGYFFKNSDAHELVFIHQGKGVLKTPFGQIEFGYGDQLIIPRGTIHQFEFEGSDNRLFIVESFSPYRFPKRYLSPNGQLLENAPFCERDLRKPTDLQTFDEKGDFLVYVKKQDQLYPYHFATHPFDYVGWDGYHYPYAFNVKDFEPITGRVHQPPPVHQVWEAHNFVICNFVPRLYDYHPDSIPAPYAHSNVDSDEVLYYVDGDFMSRNNVTKGMITLHPIGIPHGPHPGAIERSIGKKDTQELALMVDTFRPLRVTADALEIEDKNYYKSWLH